MKVNKRLLQKIRNYMEKPLTYLESLGDAEHNCIQLFPFEDDLADINTKVK